MPLRIALKTLSPAGRRGKLSVLIYHRVLDRRDPLLSEEPDAARFRAQMQWVAGWFNVIGLPEAVDRLQSGRLPERALSITFDDGYRDNCLVALPVLRELGLTATFFVASGFIGAGRMWNDTVIESIRGADPGTLDLSPVGVSPVSLNGVESRRQAIHTILASFKYLPAAERADRVEQLARLAKARPCHDLMMSEEHLRRLRQAGMTIGAHTVSHPILMRLAQEDARAEIARGKSDLETILGETVDLFAYPNGRPGRDYGPQHVDLVRTLGFRAAVSTAWGAGTADSDVYQLPRFTPWDTARWKYGLRLAMNIARGHPLSQAV